MTPEVIGRPPYATHARRGWHDGTWFLLGALTYALLEYALNGSTR